MTVFFATGFFVTVFWVTVFLVTVFFATGFFVTVFFATVFRAVAVLPFVAVDRFWVVATLRLVVLAAIFDDGFLGHKFVSRGGPD